MIEASPMFLAGFMLIIIGIALFFLATIMMIFTGFRSRKAGRIKGGGLVMIGPVPIIFGTDKETMKMLIFLSVALMVIALIFILVLNWTLLR